MAKFTISVDEDGDMILENVFSGVGLKTEDGETFGICMRDTGFEFHYNGVWYEAKGGVLKKMKSSSPDLKNDQLPQTGGI